MHPTIYVREWVVGRPETVTSAAGSQALPAGDPARPCTWQAAWPQQRRSRREVTEGSGGSEE